jgi:hypothetical protein
MNGYLFDTNIAIALLSAEGEVIQFVKEAEREQLPIYYSIITQCEILSGVNSDTELQRIELFKSTKFLKVDSSIAHRAGILRREQRLKGRKLKTPDALIIATALEHKLAVVSRDKDMTFVKKELGLPIFQP